MIQTVMENYLINRKMPKNYVEGELDFCKNEFSYQTYDVKLVKLKNCIVNKRGFVYETETRKVNKISLIDEQLYPKLFTTSHYLKKVFFKGKRIVAKGNYLLAHDDWSNEHYHWFCDVLPRLFAVKNELEGYTLLLPDSPYVKEVGLQSLEFFDLRPQCIEFLKNDELVKIDHLSIATHTCPTGRTNDKIIAAMKTYISDKIHHDASMNRLYITRDKARYRKVLNETTIWDVVKNNGYEIVRYEDLSWKDQIACASSAKSIVSMHGASLVNILFMQDKGSVLEFRRDKIYHNQCFWHLADSLGLNYFYLFGTPDDDSLPIEGMNCCNLTIDPKKLENILDIM